MPYPEIMIRPMREELTRLGFEELKTPEKVDEALQNTPGTVMLVVNSVCGCAAGCARPGIAGADIEATEKARAYFTGYRPSSPSVALLKDGQLVYLLERHQIEGRSPHQIAEELTNAFDKYCSTATAAAS